MILRQNIVDLIRKGAYSSCIITSYSFDFIFFEERLMPALKSAGVKNINLFLDGNYLDDQLENSIGKEFSNQRTYAINSVYGKGIFHPKMVLLTGPKHGLLLVGSGNISASGMSGNDEVWGAFHMNSLESPNASLFANAWAYLQTFFNYCYGFNQDKIHWITQQSAWLNDLQGLVTNGFIPVRDNLEIQFLKNEEGNAIYKQLFDILPIDGIDSLTIVSPFFDKNGSTLVNFLKDYNLGKITCLTDSSSGLLPVKMDDSSSANFTFFEWGTCINGFDNHFHRLHAKIYHFITQSGIEYLLLGSCNATSAALGGLDSDASNEEASILLKRALTSNDLLSELGISTEGATKINIRDIQDGAVKTDEIESSNKDKYKILHAELDGSSLSMNIDRKIQTPLYVVLRNKHLYETERHFIESGDSILIKIKHPDAALQVILYDDNDRVSNIRPIHNTQLLSKSNPDQSQADINNLVDSIMNSGDYSSIESIIQYLEYARSDEDFRSYSAKSGSAAATAIKSEKEYDSLTEEELNSLPAAHSFTRELLNHPNVQFADLITLLGRGILKPKEIVTEDIESSLTDKDPENQYGGDHQVGEVKHQFDGAVIKRSLIIHAKRLYDYHYSFISQKVKDHEFNQSDDSYLTLNEISNFVILIGLLTEFGFKQYEVEVTEIAIYYDDRRRKQLARLEKSYQLIKSDKVDPDELNISFYQVKKDWRGALIDELNKIDEALYIPNESPGFNTLSLKYFTEVNIDKQNGDSLKTILVDTLGVFLLHVASCKGFKHYEFDSLNQKLIQFRENLLKMGTSLILNLNWATKELDQRNILLLDLLHFVNPELEDSENILNAIQASSKFKSQYFESNWNDYIRSILHPYFRWKDTKIAQAASEISNHSIIFKSSFGFAYYRKAKPDTIWIKKPGLWWESEEDEYFEIEFPFKKILALNFTA